MHDVFISYSTKDMAQAETVRNVLEENGIPCWMAPRDIPGGSNYAREIPVAIRNCQVFVLILSENAQTSNWVIKELDSAVNCGKVILPFMLEDCPLNDEFNFLLTGAQRYAAYQKKAEVLNTLVSRIRAITGPAPEEPKTEVTAPAPVQAPPAEPKTPAPKAEPAPAQPAAPAVPKAEPAPKPAAPAAPKTKAPAKPAVPVVQKAKPKKPAKARPDRPKVKFTFGKVEALAALAVPVMALLPVAAFLLSNLAYWWDSWRTVKIDELELQLMLILALTGLLLGAGMCAEWIYFRLREQTMAPTAPVCPECGDNEINVKVFRTGRVTRGEKLLALLIPAGVVLSIPLSVLGIFLLLRLTHYYYFHTSDLYGLYSAGAVLGIAVGAWLSNRIVRAKRRKAGLRAGTCTCRDCRTTFVPVLGSENFEGKA